ncbi:PREDICTED: myosin heavy chain, clone 203-like [Tarenaya hassleriana]|uniref:myosin heavy chain, clone 203-like n=1 Tax=Tarenaya hassleriana TaxID=28532 RepID=UPI00053C2690|nr:PREDICTED: myosin heavy chain, clone 203-like [Tarenaya hassleriana]XP_010546767.1 PREDICTED: myosin heavy chain, clone 203-like [Tarenaya hassleriana]
MSDSDKAKVDPLLKDLDEKKETFRRNVVSLAAELKQVKVRLVSQEQSFVRETLCRKETEAKAKNMEMEICKLQKKLEARNCQLEAAASAVEKFLKELDDLRSQLAITNQTSEASAASAQSAQLQCSTLMQQLDEKTLSLRDHEDRVTQLGHKLDNLQSELDAREFSQKQLREEVLRIENDITEAVAKAGMNADCELRRILEGVSPKNFERINKILATKDEEISKLKDDIRFISAQWKLKTKELEGQLEKQRRADQELKKKVLKLEFCLQEARSQTRKLQRMGERRDKAIKELRDRLSERRQNESELPPPSERPNFWETSGFKIVVSMSMLFLVIVSKR